MTPQVKAAFEQHVLAEYPKEACGFIVDGQYWPCENTAEDPYRTFRIDPSERVRAAAAGTVQAVLHSHPYRLQDHQPYPPEWPSTADMKSWIADNLPWGIVSTDGEGISQPVWLDENNPAPLEGREFIHGVNDCYSLIRDEFKTRGIVLRNFARGMDWWLKGQDLYSENFTAAGFVEIPINDAVPGDCFLFQVRSPVINHAAVLTGPNTILHHLFHRLSGYDTLAKWERHIVKAVRYVEQH